jgi:60 kDa SS-A/Ro ribonucleoprotein
MYTKHFSTRVTPQSEPIPDTIANSAGGFSFGIDDWTRLNRFLILGSEGGTYYITEKKLTVDNAQCVIRCLDNDSGKTIQLICDISDGGRAPKNDPAIFALAIASGHKDLHTRKMAFDVLPDVCRTGTHIFQYAEMVEKIRGWGKLLKKGIANWYLSKDPQQLAYQVAKYQQRNGWSHRDLLRLSHPETQDAKLQGIFRWVTAQYNNDLTIKDESDRQFWESRFGNRSVDRNKIVKEYGSLQRENVSEFLRAVDDAKRCGEKEIIKLINEFNLPRECIPTQHLNSVEVWEALLEKMPLTALIRNLGKMTSIGLIQPMGERAKFVAQKLGDLEYIKKSRLHPLNILIALNTYTQGHGDKGKLHWTPVSMINDALDSCFYLSFGNVIPAGKRTMVGLDVSGSMGSSMGNLNLSCAEASAALAMIQLKTEPQYQLMAFDQRMRELDISKYSRLADVVRNTSNINGGGTDCSLPMIVALEQGWQVDTFMVYTDSETWAGNIHPPQALKKYREKTGIDARLVVLGMTANNFSIADPNDKGMLDICGFDTAVPNIMNDFSRGDI